MAAQPGPGAEEDNGSVTIALYVPITVQILGETCRKDAQERTYQAAATQDVLAGYLILVLLLQMMPFFYVYMPLCG